MAPVILETLDTDKIGRMREIESSQWRYQLTLDEYFLRDRHLDAVLFGSGYKLRYWVIEDDETGKHLGGCRALMRPAWMGRVGHKNKAVTEAVVSNLYVPPEERRKGYGTMLISHVVEQLQKRHEMVSVWSEVGDWYTKFGFKLVEELSYDVIVEPYQDFSVWMPGVEKLGMDSWEDIKRSFSSEVDDQIYDLTQANNRSMISVAPHIAMFNYYTECSRYVTNHVPTVPTASVFGAQTELAWAFWAPLVDRDTMSFMVGHGALEDQVPLIKGCLAEATRYKVATRIPESSLLGHSADDLVEALKKEGIISRKEVRQRLRPMYLSEHEYRIDPFIHMF